MDSEEENMDLEEENMDSEVRKGTITKITLTNFMAIEHLEYCPGPYLNMLIGRNGSGKSSIVCAIVLCLGGKPKTIGRTALLKDYVNSNGGNKANIVIELKNSGGPNFVVQREFTKENKNTWHLNGQSASQKEVDEFMETLNIQVDNLCQFLPQDKVHDFAKMNAQQLLENTVKTVGSTDMIEWHTLLVTMRTDEEEVQKLLETKINDLTRQKQILSGLKIEAKFIKEREKILQQINLMKQKQAWAAYGEADVELQEVAAEREALLKLKCEAEKVAKPYKLELQRTKDELISAERELHQFMDKIGPSLNSVNRKINETERLDENIQRIDRELEAALENTKRKEQEIAKLTHSISVFESTGLDLSEEKQLDIRAKEVQEKLKNTSSRVTVMQANEDNLKHELSAIENCLRRTEMRINNTNDLKDNVFRRKSPDAHELMMWLKDNRNIFRGHVYDPIQLEVSVKTEYARYVEHAIPYRDLEAFVCEYNEDVSTLLRIARIEKKLSINAISVEGITNVKYQPTNNIKNLSAFGFQCYVLDNIKGPQPIINYLCKTYGIHNIPIGTNATEKMLESIPQSVSVFFAGENHHSIRVSKYSGEKISKVMRVRSNLQVFVNTTDTELVRELIKTQEVEQQKLNESRLELRQVHIELEAAEQDREKLKNEKKEVFTKLNELKSARTNVAMKKEELMILKQSMVDPKVLEQNARQQRKEVISHMVALQSVVQKAISHHKDIVVKSKFCQLKQSWADVAMKKKERLVAEHLSSFEATKRNLQIKEGELANAEQEVKKAYKTARLATEGFVPKDKEFRDRYANQFVELPDSVDELQSNMEKLKAKIACMGEGRHQAIEEYEKQVERVNELESELKAPELDLQSIKAKMEAVKVKWMSSVTELISQINEKYMMFFTRMRCVGEVSLYKPPAEEDYQNYGIVIKVKFRNSDRLKELGPYRQSGGERAISTAIYMLALQHLTTVPFRCVDEINQGMDEKNERIMYKLLMETTEESAAAQYFLLTPKLIPCLEYTDRTVVSCIMKGDVVPFDQFNLTKAIQSKIQQLKNQRNCTKRKHSDSEEN